MPRFPIHPGAIYGIAKEIRTAAEEFRPLLVGGASGAAGELARALSDRGEPGALRDVSGRALGEGDLAGADALLYVTESEAPSAEDEQALRLAARKGVGTVCLLVGADDPPPPVPYVLATDVVPVAAGERLPLELVCERLATRLGERGYILASRLPVLRRAVCERIVRDFAWKNGLLGAAVFVPGADLPVLALNQIRMVFRIAAAYGQEMDRDRAVELLAVIGAGFGLRALARRVLTLVPGPGWVYKAGVAYAGTRAIGEAAIAFFEGGGFDRVLDA